ncbi:transposase family protein [Streptomyces sp. NPDC023723]|uniref:transposase family protein n=1 Tax=Streptomyces sp. NPDC023723 TaxID=3154323 RepID=UPI0033D8DC2C
MPTGPPPRPWRSWPHSLPASPKQYGSHRRRRSYCWTDAAADRSDRPFYSCKHKKHGMNVQIATDPAEPAAVGLTGPAGRDPQRPRRSRARHRQRSRRGRHHVLGGQGPPRSGRYRLGKLSAGQQAVNRSNAKIRALVEPAIAALKTWRLPRKLRCSTTHVTQLVQAALTLHLTTTN